MSWSEISMSEVDVSNDGRLSCVVYCVTNIVNGKKYIGKTKGTLRRRISGHRYDAFVKNSPYAFHAALRKHGVESFTVQVLDVCSSLEELRFSEITRIKEHRAFETGYNMTLGEEGILGFKHDEETKRRISDMKKGKPIKESARKKLEKPVQQINPQTGEIIEQFDSISAAERLTGASNVGMCCSGKIGSAGGFLWKYVDESHMKKGRWCDDSRFKMRERLVRHRHKDRAVLQIDPKTGIILNEFPSIRAAETASGATNVSGVCRGIRKQSGGFSWRYK